MPLLLEVNMVWPQGAAAALLSMDLDATLATQVTTYRVIVAFLINAFAQMAMHPTEQAREIGTSWLVCSMLARAQTFKVVL